jgi:hypothetical protein
MIYIELRNAGGVFDWRKTEDQPALIYRFSHD